MHAIALFSGGLDSMLAARLIMEQGITVTAIQFASPFFNHRFLADPAARVREIEEKYGITAEVHDVSAEYLELLRAPRHGFGKNFNPCIDCKIFLLTRAKEIMHERGASFLVTGEVVGQRPMSQRRDTLNVIMRDSGCADILLRPLCAKHLPATRPEREGLVDREKLLDFCGRGRRRQMELAKHFNITDYPSPAGGCILTDPILAARVRTYYERLARQHQQPDLADLLLLLKGRHFHLPGGAWLVMGRNANENPRIAQMTRPGDHLLYCRDFTGPTGILRQPAHIRLDDGEKQKTLQLAAGLLAGYSRLPAATPTVKVLLEHDATTEQIAVTPLADPETRRRYQQWESGRHI